MMLERYRHFLFIVIALATSPLLASCSPSGGLAGNEVNDLVHRGQLTADKPTWTDTRFTVPVTNRSSRRITADVYVDVDVNRGRQPVTNGRTKIRLDLEPGATQQINVPVQAAGKVTFKDNTISVEVSGVPKRPTSAP